MRIEAKEPNDYDCNLMYRWRNDPAIRAMSHNQEYIHWHDHEKWFREKMLLGECHLVMLCLGDARIGVGRLDLDDDYGAEFSIYLNPDFIGKRLGVAAITALLRYGFDDNGFYNIYGETKLINKSARHTFTKAGMVPHFDKPNVVRFTMDRLSWKQLSQAS